jgi:quinol monooxygenase YgiN
MFIARVTLTIQDRQRDEFRRFASAEALEARALAGCVEYAFCEDVADPSRVLLYEEWSSRDAFEAYKKSALFEASGARLMPMLAGAPKSSYYESDDLFGACAVARRAD